MRYSLDNGLTFQYADKIQVIYDGLCLLGEGENINMGSFEVNLRKEHISMDVWNESSGENPGSQTRKISKVIQDLISGDLLED